VQSITYRGLPLPNHINASIQGIIVSPNGIVLPQLLLQSITNLLDTLTSTPPLTNRRKVLLADQIFGLRIQTNPANPKFSVQFWTSLLPLVWSWEDVNAEVHKGTLYYLMAEDYLELGDVPSAYTCLFKALEEDKRNSHHFRQPLNMKPAYLTSCLVDDSNNRLHASVVVPLRNRMLDHVTLYNTGTGSHFSVAIMDRKFLQAIELEDIKRFFVATFHEIFHLTPLHLSRMINNDYSKLKAIDILFNLGLIVDQLLEYRFLRYSRRRDRNLANGLYKLALRLRWTTRNKTPSISDFLRLIRPNLNVGTPNKTVPALLDGRARFDGLPIDRKMMCVFLTYHLRNFGGHHIESQDILVKRYPEILEHCLNSIFVAIEAL
jgi:hypothetical protein